jgi:CelD/BcsL family acetyltransferase involved in cellulose biosynthesis
MAPTERSRVAVVVIDGAEGFAHLRDEWEALHRRSGRELSLSYAWSRAVADVHGGPGDRIRIVTLRRDGVLVGLLPLLARAVPRAFRQLTPLADSHVTHSDWLTDECSGEIADGLVEGLLEAGISWDRFRMSGVFEHNPLLPHVLAALHRRGLRYLLRRKPPARVLRLPDTYETYLGQRSAKFRNHLKRVQKKVQAHRADVSVLVGERSPSLFTDTFARMLEIEQASWKHADQWPMTADGAATHFYRQVFASAWAEGRLHVQFLVIDGQPAAYNLGYLVGDEYAYLKTTFASGFKHLGAATFLRGKLIEDLIARGIRLVDFAGEPYDWERQWTHEIRGHVMLTVYSGRLRSRVLEALERLRHARAVDDVRAYGHEAGPA